MDGKFSEKFLNSLHTGFIDKTIDSDHVYRPQLLTNKQIPREKVLSSIIQELETCNEFFISVAFLTASGLATLHNTLLELERRGVTGKILVSQYLNFTQPEALKKLSRFSNIELRICTDKNTHVKGYIFRKDDHYSIIIGSSNLTADALTFNKEWNLKVAGLNSSGIVDKLLNEFTHDFEIATVVTDDFITRYQEVYDKNKLFQQKIASNNKEVERQVFTPNSMQRVALQNLHQLRNENKTKALIISATGTGKTFLSAFDVLNFNPKRLLFVVHRQTIARDALETFKLLFGDSRTFGLYSGSNKELDSDFIFSTVQTVSREENLYSIERDAFDYIIIDESHRSGAESYTRLINHFQPKFLLGMTATPERTDGADIFSLFDHNIAYEIRLNKAMEEEMLSEFHYFGITDLIVNEEQQDNLAQFNKLQSNDRVDQIIKYINLYGSDNGITRGLVFCSSNKDASYLSNEFNLRGYRTVALSGESSESLRADSIAKLESDDNHQRLDYIFTVDIFNEGIDIPRINQIVMIRPTESAIIFVQQLGRGLRKADGKDYLTIIDFIGNHRNNYLIPIALYGDTSYNKDSLRKLISEGSKLLPGSSTINFDAVSKEKIFQSIDSANMRILADLRKDYQLLKYRLGRIPMMVDFLINESRDPFLFVEYDKSYYNFVLRVDDTQDKTLDRKQIELLQLFSNEINNAKRVEESLLLEHLISNTQVSTSSFVDLIKQSYGYEPSASTMTSLLNNLNFTFVRKSESIVKMEGNNFELHPTFSSILKNATFKKYLADSIQYSVQTFTNRFSLNLFRDGLILYQKYGRKDACRLLNWEKDISATVYGYRTVNEITPCFITYHKSSEVDDSVNYNDHFISPSIFAWESRSNRKIESTEIQNVINSKRVLLFVKKEDAEGTDFYFLGNVSIIDGSVEQAMMPKSNQPVVHFKFQLETPVPEDLYNYLTATHRTLTSASLQEEKNQTINTNLVPRKTIPLYNLLAAAGTFKEMEEELDYVEIGVDEKYTRDDNYFACTVVGESMNRRIPNGSICIFKKYEGGSRNGKIVLVENYGKQDPEFLSSFTVKTYSSQKSQKEDTWGHDEIVLKPNSTNPAFEDIVLDEDMAQGMRVIGEFVEILNPSE